MHITNKKCVFLSSCFRLVYYLHPTDEELRNLAGIPKEKGKKGKGGGGKSGGKGGGGNGGGEDNGGFTVPRNLDLSLETSRLGPGEVIQLKFYSEYQWLLDFSLCAVLVYIITEVPCLDLFWGPGWPSLFICLLICLYSNFCCWFVYWFVYLLYFYVFIFIINLSLFNFFICF